MAGGRLIELTGLPLERQQGNRTQWLPATILEEHDAFFTLDHQWRITYLNGRAAALLLGDRERLVGRVLWEACPGLDETGYGQQLRRAVRDHDRLEFEEFHPQLGAWFEVVAHPWEEGLAVSSRDVSERKRRERRDLYFRVADAAITASPDVKTAMASFARGVAALTGWAYVETWAPGADGSLRCLEVVRADRPGYAEFERFSRSVLLDPGVGLVGSAFATRTPMLNPDLTRMSSPRALLGNAAGFRTGLALPIFAHATPIGVVAFFSDSGPEDDWFRVVAEHRPIELLFERRYAQEALRRSEERHRLLFEDGAVPMMMYDVETLRLLAVNQRATELYGFGHDELLALSLHDLLPPDERPWLEPQALEHESRQWLSAQSRHKKKDGAVFPVSVASHQLTLDGRQVRVMVIADITEAQRALSKLQEQATLLDSANDAIVVRDLGGRITYWNQGAERTYGRSALEALGSSFAELTSAARGPFDEASAALAQTGDWSGDLTHQLRDKQKVLIATRWTYVRSERGEPRSILSIGTDITERKKLETQYLRAQRVETIGTLAGGIAHDLNNMLTPILISVPLLRSERLEAEELSILDGIEAAAQRGAAMVKQILLFSRGQTGEKLPLRPAALLKDTARIAADSMPKNIEVRLDVPDDLPWLAGDPTQLQQVLVNLSVNARDAMPDGGVLTLRARAVELDGDQLHLSPSAKPGRHVVLEVLDNGTGIAPEIRERIFDPFFTTKEVGKGTGLGLATSLAIARSHSGFFNVYSEPGKGSDFKLFLPALPDTAAAAAEAAEVVPLPRGQGQLVLVVDDEAPIRDVARRTLEAMGYCTKGASNGAEALAEYAQAVGQIDLVLVDMSMPVMDGISTIRALQHLDPKVRIISASGLGVNGAFARASATGVKRFLQKPYTASELLRLVHDALAEQQ